jgi:5-bromo-4-chloroindolyl phosphate hydrolysis protein
MLSHRGRSDLIGGVGAAIVLLASVLVLHLALWVGVPLALVVYVALRLLIPAPSEVAIGMTQAEANRVIREGESKVAQIRALAQSIPRKPVQRRVQRIAGMADNIYADFKDDPKDISQIPDFATTYLDPLVKVLQQYTRLASRPMASQSDTLAKIEDDVLPKVETAFGGLYKQLVEDDVVDLDAASEGLKSLMDIGSA